MENEYNDRINEISEICNTTIIYDSMTKDQIIDIFYETLHRIDELAIYK